MLNRHTGNCGIDNCKKREIYLLESGLSIEFNLLRCNLCGMNAKTFRPSYGPEGFLLKMAGGYQAANRRAFSVAPRTSLGVNGLGK